MSNDNEQYAAPVRNMATQAQRILDLEQALTNLRDMSDGWRNQLEEHCDRIAELERMADADGQVIAGLRTDLAKVKEQRDGAEAYNKDIRLIRNERDEAQAEAGRLREALVDYTGRCDEYRRDITHHIVSAAALRVALQGVTGLPCDWGDESHIAEACVIQRRIALLKKDALIATEEASRLRCEIKKQNTTKQARGN
jgi:chromosome segregation ATPase